MEDRDGGHEVKCSYGRERGKLCYLGRCYRRKHTENHNICFDVNCRRPLYWLYVLQRTRTVQRSLWSWCFYILTDSSGHKFISMLFYKIIIYKCMSNCGPTESLSTFILMGLFLMIWFNKVFFTYFNNLVLEFIFVFHFSGQLHVILSSKLPLVFCVVRKKNAVNFIK